VHLLVLSLPREAALPSPVVERGEGDFALSLSLSLSLFSSKEALFETSARFLQLHALSRIEEK
jgi:hypothetical protein